MVAKVELTWEAIRLTVAECEHMGRAAFLDAYGFKGAKGLARDGARVPCFCETGPKSLRVHLIAPLQAFVR